MAKIRKYQDFILELDNYDEASGQYQVRLPPSDEWGAPAPVTIDLKYPEIEDPLADLQAKDIYIEDLIPLGKQLADRLLPAGPIRSNFIAAVRDASVDNGVRLRIMTRDVKLAQLPWEYTYLPLADGAEDNRANFLAVNPKVSLVRNPPLAGRVKELALADPTKLTLAGVMANPVAPGFNQLDLKTERRFIEKALKGFKGQNITVEWEPFIENATEAELDQALLTKPDVFHFAGHGVFSHRDDQGSIIMVNNKTSLDPVYVEAQDFAKKVAAASTRLVYLGACETSALQDASAWKGVAQALIAEGVLAVVAMQYGIVDSKAIIFAKSFYDTLIAGLTIDEAVMLGRVAVMGQSDDKGVEWGVPTLYLRTQKGILIKNSRGRQSERAVVLKKINAILIQALEKGKDITKIEIFIDPQTGKVTITF